MNRIGPAPRPRFLAFRPLGPSFQAVCFATLTACATSPAPAARTAETSAQRIEPGTPASDRLTVPRDGDAAKLVSVIASLEQRVAGDTGDGDARLRLAEAHYVMAESIATLGWKDQGEPRAHLVTSTQTIAGMQNGEALYWLGASTYALAKLDGYGALLDAQATVQRMMETVLKTAPQLDRGGAHRVLASLAAHPADPSLRDLKRARAHAQAALAIDGRAAANLSAFIEHYAVPAQDRAAVAEKLHELGELEPAASDDAVAGARAEQLAASIEERLE